ncbi:MAG: hypothetical protein DRH70_06205 [Candidatus Coatesbacteria bacterium]|nr:MAG: hypothetical protein DRH70_06205 [Candidatus Coatesbacteria bacterium]
MIYLVALLLIGFILAFSGKILVTSLLVQLFNRTKKIREILRPVLLYEFGAFCFFEFIRKGVFFTLNHWFQLAFGFIFSFFLSLLVLISTLFFIFAFVMKEYSLLNPRQSLAVFLIIFFIVTPIIFLSKVIIEGKILRSSNVFGVYTSFLEEKNRFPGLIPTLPSIAVSIEIDKLNDIFLEKEFLIELRKFIMTVIYYYDER